MSNARVAGENFGTLCSSVVNLTISTAKRPQGIAQHDHRPQGQTFKVFQGQAVNKVLLRELLAVEAIVYNY